MKDSPPLDEFGGSSPESTGKEPTIVDPDECGVATVDRVEVGRVVVCEVHEDHDPEEFAESRHCRTVRSRCDITPRGVSEHAVADGGDPVVGLTPAFIGVGAHVVGGAIGAGPRAQPLHRRLLGVQ